jgi:RHS repeat-associated protein
LDRTDSSDSSSKGGAEATFGVQAPSISLPKGGGSIRGIGEKFTVNAVTGTGAMSVPIYATPGRDGFGPQLSLNYDSGAGDGLFGLGWGLSLPSISRKTDKGLPRYFDPKEFDVFLLSGSEDLVPMYAKDAQGNWQRNANGDMQFLDQIRDGYLVRSYQPRIEGLFARIERWSRLTDSDTHWRSISKDNVLTVYGRSATSRVANPADPTQVFSWLICESYDDKGNAVVYSYAREDDTDVDLSQSNERNRVRNANQYLKSVQYGNQTPILIDSTLPSFRRSHLPAPDFSKANWMFELLFDYGDVAYADAAADPNGRIFTTVDPTPAPQPAWAARLDPFSNYRSGFERRTYRLCQRALMLHHFPEELGVSDYLVRATEFTYAQKPSGSLLLQVLQSGYKRQDDGGYLKRSMPPLSFSYAASPLEDDTYQSLTPGIVAMSELSDLPAGIDNQDYRWIDLKGEGIAGIFSEQADAWWYKSNLGEGQFSEAHCIRQQPLWHGRDGTQPGLLDLVGDGRVDLVEFEAPTPGFYAQTPDSQWEPFRTFAKLPSLDWHDSNFRFVDLSGDGLADIFITSEEGGSTWYESLGREGFSAAHRIFSSLDEEQGPRLVFADGTQSVFLADMSGDGLVDVVRIRQGEAAYWPNEGYGRFGPKVLLDNVPDFDDLENFDPRRLRLADTDGSGPADVIYLGRDGIRVYLNQRGNSLSAPKTLGMLPIPDELSMISVVDFLGRGTACLVYASPLPGDSQTALHYLDLMNGIKPRLLIQIDNNMGAQTQLSYASSTHFYLADKAAGTPWVTRLPFPVQVVAQLESRDLIAGTRLISTYTYHHGHFSGEEREFRGFGRVDQKDTEEFGVLFPGTAATDSAAAFYVPPVLTKTWFHTGAAREGQRISRCYEHEYFREGNPDTGQSALTDSEFEALLLDDTVLPPDLANGEVREAVRALKGSVLRQEIYALDGSEAADRPYLASERNYTLAPIQPRGTNRHSVFFVHAREAVEYHYERQLYPILNGKIVDAGAAGGAGVRWLADPRVTHSMVTRTDSYGNVQQSLTFAYGRRFDCMDTAFTDADRAAQKTLLVTLSDSDMTNAIVDTTQYPDAYRTPLSAGTTTYEMVNFLDAYTAIVPWLILQLDITNLFKWAGVTQLVTGSSDGAIDVAYEDLTASQLPAGKLGRRMIECVQTLYRKNDLSQLLPYESLEPLALPGQSYKLAFTPGLLSGTFKRTLSGQATEALIPNPSSLLPIDATHEADRGGYVDLEGDSRWWVPSGRVFYHPDDNATPAAELTEAVAHFFVPRRVLNPFGHSSYVNFDQDLLLGETTDALGNQVQATHDYRVLQPNTITDANGNQTFAAFDALGLLVASALAGKAGDKIGDSLSDFGDFDANPTLKDLQAYVRDPAANAAALLKSATTRFVYDLDRFSRCDEPPFSSTLLRETHLSDLIQGAVSKIQLTFTYSDGFGRELQSKIQAEAGTAPQRAASTTLPSGDTLPGALNRDGTGQLILANTNDRWIGKGRVVFNNKGKPVKQYEPFFSGTLLYEPEADMTDSGVTPILFYDSLQRLVATLHANHSYDKVLFDPWQQLTWDVNDTILNDPSLDPDTEGFFERLPAADYLPTWYQQRQNGGLGADENLAAANAAKHANTPTAAYLDSLGRNFLSMANNGADGLGNPVRFRTSTMIDIQGNPRQVIDALARTVMRYDYDMLGRPIHQNSMDAGERWSVSDAVGKTLCRWDGRGHNFTTSYDRLRRPLQQQVSGTSIASDPRTYKKTITFETITYGEGQATATAQNLRTRAFRYADSAGVLLFQDINPATGSNESYDFKGNLLRSTRQLFTDYKSLPDWSTPAQPDRDTYSAASRYDALNRTVQAISAHSNKPGSTLNVIQHTFNRTNLLQQVDVWLGLANEPPTLLDSLTQVPAPVGVSNIDYDAKGQRAIITYANAVTTAYTYDAFTFRLSKLLTSRPAAAFPADCPNPPLPGWPGCQVQNLSYVYDPIGNVAQIRDAAQQTVYFKGVRVDPSNQFVYDPTYRLLSATGREQLAAGAPIPHSYNDVLRTGLPQPGDGTALGLYTESYVYDAVGNFLSMSHARTDAQAPGWVRNYVYNEPSLIDATAKSNRLTSSTVSGSPTETYSVGGNGYDAHGNSLDLPQLSIMAWDFKDQLLFTQRQSVDTDTGDTRLTQGERTYYVYDFAGQRTRKVTERATGAIKDQRLYLNEFETYLDNSAAPATWETLHVMDDKRRVALVETRTSPEADTGPVPLIRYQFDNHLGSSSLEIDDQARVISFEEYTPLGSTSYQALDKGITANAKRYRYSAKERDEESGLYYFGARYYAPWLGRWVSADPLGLKDGPNPFVYTQNNPVNLVDPNGTESAADRPFVNYEINATAKVTHGGPEGDTFSRDVTIKVSIGGFAFQYHNHDEGPVFAPREGDGPPVKISQPAPRTVERPTRVKEPAQISTNDLPVINDSTNTFHHFTDWPLSTAFEEASKEAVNPSNSLVVREISGVLARLVAPVALAESIVRGVFNVPYDADLAGQQFARAGLEPNLYAKVDLYAQAVTNTTSAFQNAAVVVGPAIGAAGKWLTTPKVYSVAYETNLKPTSYPSTSRTPHYIESNENLLREMEGDPEFAQTMKNAGVELERTPTDLAPREPPAGWTWHHNATQPGLMQLVPRYQHQFGSLIWSLFHPDGAGGWANWGKIK